VVEQEDKNMTPTTPVHPNQRIDQTITGGVVVEETIYNYPPDGGGTRRVENSPGNVTTTAVTGLAIPQPSAEERQANYKTAMAAAVTLQDAKEAAALWL
jgi:hypothetical protein